MTTTETPAPPDGQTEAAATALRKTPARKRLVPYWLLLPGILWLIVFFALPMIYQGSTSVQTGSLEEGYKVTWHFATYWDALGEYWPQFVRSVLYAATATVLCLLVRWRGCCGAGHAASSSRSAPAWMSWVASSPKVCAGLQCRTTSAPGTRRPSRSMFCS